MNTSGGNTRNTRESGSATDLKSAATAEKQAEQQSRKHPETPNGACMATHPLSPLGEGDGVLPQPTTRRETLIVLVNLLRAIGDRGVSPEQAAEIGHRAEILKKPTRKQRCAGAAWLLERAVACGLAVKDDSGAFRPLLHNLPRSLEAPTTARGAWFCEFTHCPEIGTRIVRRDGLGFVLVAAEPYTRKSDGAASFLLTWLSDDGRKATTGLRSSSVRWQRSEVR